MKEPIAKRCIVGNLSPVKGRGGEHQPPKRIVAPRSGAAVRPRLVLYLNQLENLETRHVVA